MCLIIILKVVILMFNKYGNYENSIKLKSKNVKLIVTDKNKA